MNSMLLLTVVVSVSGTLLAENSALSSNTKNVTLPSEAIRSRGSRATVFQYRIPVTTTKGERDAFLWIPPRARQVRGIVLGGMTLMEREFVKDPIIRQACAAEQLAILFLKCGLRQVDVQAVLGSLVRVTGYHELSAAPLMFVGHSAGGPQAKELTVKMVDRCFGLVMYRGGIPGGQTVVPPGVPVLMMVGQYDEFGGTMRDENGRETWEGGRDATVAFRTADPRHLASIAVEPGAGHFAWSRRNADYLALFIRKAAKAMIPAQSLTSSVTPMALNQIDYRDGWLSDLDLMNQNAEDAAPWERYQGDRQKAAWHFDEDMARATLAYHGKALAKRDQFIRWQDPHWVDAGARYFFNKIDWVGDGQSFAVHPAYAPVYPSQIKGKGPCWAEAGNPIGHADVPILVKPVGGPIVAGGPQTLRIQYDALAPATRNERITFMAYSKGGDTYRYTEQVGMLPRGFKGLTKGKEQTITFPCVESLPANSPPLTLQATSDAGQPVEYYVAYGPAVVEEGKLSIRDVPGRALFPLTVKVVAYQFGRGVAPLVKTALPVERTIQITR